MHFFGFSLSRKLQRRKPTSQENSISKKRNWAKEKLGKREIGIVTVVYTELESFGIYIRLVNSLAKIRFKLLKLDMLRMSGNFDN
jgi:hypothetical protein